MTTLPEGANRRDRELWYNKPLAMGGAKDRNNMSVMSRKEHTMWVVYYNELIKGLALLTQGGPAFKTRPYQPPTPKRDAVMRFILRRLRRYFPYI